MDTTVRRRFNRILSFALLIIISAVFFVSSAVETQADDTLLSDMSYELLFTQEKHANMSSVQSVCVTEDYIITIENVADDNGLTDVVSAYYRNAVDAEGKSVQQYSLAMVNDGQTWEHGNGMCYNPNTGEIYVAPYTSLDSADRGCLFVMDPNTLQAVRSIKISDDFDILSVAYDRQQDVYYIQTNADQNYNTYILDNNFQIIDDLGITDPAPGYNLQAFYKIGDYIIQSPLTINAVPDNYINAYDAQTNQLLDCVIAEFGQTGCKKVEPEQITRLDDDSFILVVDTTMDDGTGTAYFYRIIFPNLPMEGTLFKNAETQIAEETSEESEKETSEESTEETSEESTEETSEESTEETSENSTEETSEKSTEETSAEEISEKSTEETSDESIEETTTESSEEQVGTETGSSYEEAQSDDEVTITKEKTEGLSDNIEQIAESKHRNSPIALIIAVIFAVAFGWYVNVIRIKRARKRRDARIRLMRKKAMRQVRESLEEFDDDFEDHDLDKYASDEYNAGHDHRDMDDFRGIDNDKKK